jgi:pimeloyl-ACP methyl ester carboxylesterase
MIEPFSPSVPVEHWEDLHRRLAAIRWPDREPIRDRTQGVPLDDAQAVVEHWRLRYDWRGFTDRLNRFPHFRTSIDGVSIDFTHVRSPEADALPILLTHGWPGSILEFTDVIGPLTDPVRHGAAAGIAFHVVIPSLPGFGLSEAPREMGWGPRRIARAWAELMAQLGYERWVAQGGDWGAEVTHRLAQLKPAGLVAAHVNWPFVVPEPLPNQPTEAERRAVAELERFKTDGYGYFHQQETRPQTVGYGLADSPVGLAMWMYEKFRDWADPRHPIPLDRILDSISLYWLTNSATSSARLYWEAHREGGGPSAGSIDLPMAATIFPYEVWRAPRLWAEKLWPNLFYWSEVDRGGHFAALEQPSLFVDELRAAFENIERREPR